MYKCGQCFIFVRLNKLSSEAKRKLYLIYLIYAKTEIKLCPNHLLAIANSFKMKAKKDSQDGDTHCTKKYTFLGIHLNKPYKYLFI